MNYSRVAAALTFLQLFRFVNIAVLRGTGEVKIPRTIAMVCVLIINPSMSYLLTVTLSFGVWGIRQASVATQMAWCLRAGSRRHPASAGLESLRMNRNRQPDPHTGRIYAETSVYQDRERHG